MNVFEFVLVIVLIIILIMQNKLQQNKIIMITALVICVIMAVLQGRRLAYYDSLEEAIERVEAEKIRLVVEGKETDFAITEKNAIILEKGKDGWRIPSNQLLVKHASVQMESLSIYAMRYNYTNEYYITIMDLNGKELEVKDNRDSNFYVLDNVNGNVYYAYVYGLDEDYIVSINGAEYQLN